MGLPLLMPLLHRLSLTMPPGKNLQIDRIVNGTDPHWSWSAALALLLGSKQQKQVSWLTAGAPWQCIPLDNCGVADVCGTGYSWTIPSMCICTSCSGMIGQPSQANWSSSQWLHWHVPARKQEHRCLLQLCASVIGEQWNWLNIFWLCNVSSTKLGGFLL